MLELNQRRVMTSSEGCESRVHRSEMLKGRLTPSPMDNKEQAVLQGRFGAIIGQRIPWTRSSDMKGTGPNITVG